MSSNQNELIYPYLKMRKDFGRQPQFLEDHPRVHVDIMPDKRFRKRISRFLYVNKEVQAIPGQSENEMNTVRALYTDAGMYHYEGGWPKDVNLDDPEQIGRYKKKIEKDESYTSAMLGMTKQMERFIKQNNAMDIYSDFFGNAWKDADIHRASPQANVVQVYRDQNTTYSRSISKITWAPDNSGKFAVAHCPVEFDPRLRDSSKEASLWDIDNSNKPEILLKNADSHICDLKYNTKDKNIIIGACFNGTVCTWDLRTGSNYTQVSSLENGHSDICTNVLWVNSKTGTEFFSSGLDGQIIWWDTRNLAEPLESTWLDPEKGSCRPEFAEGCTILEYDNTLPTKFMAGTENGSIMILMRKGKGPNEKLNHLYKAHRGPVRGLQRNPMFIKNFLTVGDYTCRIFAEDCKESSILWTTPRDVQYTHGMWIPTRASSFVCSRSDGHCDFWDMLIDPVKPYYDVKVSDDALTCVAPSENGQFIAVGSISGNVSLLKLATSMITSEKNDKPVLAAIFERESKREKILEQRNRELRLKKRDKDKFPVEEEKKPGLEEEIAEDPVVQAEKDFFTYIRQEMDEKGVDAFPEKKPGGDEEENNEEEGEEEGENKENVGESISQSEIKPSLTSISKSSISKEARSDSKTALNSGSSNSLQLQSPQNINIKDSESKKSTEDSKIDDDLQKSASKIEEDEKEKVDEEKALDELEPKKSISKSSKIEQVEEEKALDELEPKKSISKSSKIIENGSSSLDKKESLKSLESSDSKKSKKDKTPEKSEETSKKSSLNAIEMNEDTEEEEEEEEEE